jgi:DUF4097 and DUF4098 domain-containing protein YvlB
MKKIALFVLLFALVFNFTACRAGDIDLGFYAPYWNAWNYTGTSSFTYSASEITEVDITWVDGSIEIVSSKNEELRVTENSESLEEDAKMHYLIKDGKLTVHYTMALYREDVDSAYKNLRIEIPEGVELDVDSVNASIKIDEMALGKVKLTNVSGIVDFANLACSDVKIENVDGNVEADEIVADKFSASSVSGSLNISKISANEIDVSTVSGKTVLGVAKKGEVEISGMSGDIELHVSNELGATIKFSTMSGDLLSDKPHRKGEKEYTFGLGEIEIKVETMSGDLKIF